MKTAEQILEQQVNAQNYPITDYIGKDGYVWKMILKAMEEYAAQQANGVEASDETALPIQNVTNCPLCGGELTFEDNTKCMTADCPNCIF